MTTPWLVRIATRTHPFLLPSLYLLCSFGYLSLVVTFTTGRPAIWNTDAALWGTIFLYCLLPAYFLFCQPFAWKRTRTALVSLTGMLPNPDDARARVLEVPVRWQLTGMLLGAVHGLWQYVELIRVLDESTNPWLDISMTAANMLSWAAIGWMLACRLYSSGGLSRVGQALPVDLYDQGPLRPFAQVATLDVLIVMGAVVLMPLQSLDAEFRWTSYQAGVFIAVPSALLFFLLPLLGVHEALERSRHQRVEELQATINRCDHSDIVRLHALIAHQQSVKAMSTWPVDLQLIGRAVFYLVIPPLAWIGAALVEKLVDRMV